MKLTIMFEGPGVLSGRALYTASNKVTILTAREKEVPCPCCATVESILNKITKAR